MTAFESMVAGEDGWSEWRRPLPGYLMKCCDCGLVHEMDFAVVRRGKDLGDGYFESEDVDDPTILVMFRARRAVDLPPPTKAPSREEVANVIGNAMGKHAGPGAYIEAHGDYVVSLDCVVDLQLVADAILALFAPPLTALEAGE